MYSLHLLAAWRLSGLLCHVTAGIHHPHAASRVFSPCLCGSPATDQKHMCNASWPMHAGIDPEEAVWTEG